MDELGLWRFPRRGGSGFCLVLLCILITLGCRAEHPAGGASEAVGARPGESPDSADAAGLGLEEEYWEAYYIEGAKVGHAQTVVERIEEAGEERIRITHRSRLRMQRFGQSLEQRIELVSVETPDGRLVRFESSQEPPRTTARGEVDGEVLRIESSSLGRTERTSIPWEPGYGGLFADQRSLRREPLRPGETRTLTALVPLFNQAGKIQLRAVAQEPAELAGGRAASLLRIDATLQIGDTQIPTSYWVTPDGAIQKSATAFSGIEQVALRTTPEDAQREGLSADFDLGARSVVRVARPLADPHATRRVVYRARLETGDPAGLFVADHSQQVRPLEPRTAEITVVAVRPDGPVPGAATPPADSDRAANNLIQSDDPVIVAMARRVAPAEDGWPLARALERHVHASVRSRAFSQALASAADVARSLEGDCTEHAVLLAALCRARGLPARVAIGLVYFQAEQAYAYHMWTEVWVQDRWMPLDATLGRGGIGGAHLKIGTSDLAAATAYSALLPVLELLGRLELEIVEVE